jgi:hypothetical protein
LPYGLGSGFLESSKKKTARLPDEELEGAFSAIKDWNISRHFLGETDLASIEFRRTAVVLSFSA